MLRDRPVSFRVLLALGAALAIAGAVLPATWVRARTDAEPPPPMKPRGPFRPDLVVLPAGRFMMGSPKDEPGRPTAEERKISGWLDEPEHEVSVDTPFAIGATEVTQAQWREVMGTDPSFFGAAHGGGDDHPVERVSAYDAIAYLNRLSELEGFEVCYRLGACRGTPGGGCEGGKEYCDGDYHCDVAFAGVACPGYRLPSEVEWEYAARAGMRTAIFTGSFSPDRDCRTDAVDAVGWFCGNSELAGGEDCSEWPDRRHSGLTTCGTQPVRGKRASPWRLYDVIGNVFEWAHRVEDGRILGVGEEGSAVMRGCSWLSDARNCRAAYRLVSAPSRRDDYAGFRLVRSVPRPSIP